MGREIKRVALDFSWPLNQVWDGFINPYYNVRDCPKCEGRGLAPEALMLFKQWFGYTDFDPASTGSVAYDANHETIKKRAERNYPDSTVAARYEAHRLAQHFNTWQHHLDQNDVDALLAEGRLMDFTRNGIERPTAKQVNEWSIDFGFGHDAINEWICVREKCKRLGYQHTCEHCKGEGHLWNSETDRENYEAWQETEPPAGDGWQLWENVSEGSPVSPVFPTEEAFKAYLVGEGYSDHAASEFIKQGWAMSMMMVGGKIYQNIDAFDARHDAT